MKTLLILRFSSIGDIVLTTSVLSRLRHEYPNVRLVFVTKQSFVGLVPDGVEVIGFNRFNGDFVARLRAVKADAILDLHANLRTRWIKLLLWNIPSFSLNKQRFGRWIFLQTHKQWIPLKHVVQRYHDAVEAVMGYFGKEVSVVNNEWEGNLGAGRDTDLWSRYRDWETDRKSTRLNSSHLKLSRMPSSA